MDISVTMGMRHIIIIRPLVDGRNIIREKGLITLNAVLKNTMSFVFVALNYEFICLHESHMFCVAIILRFFAKSFFFVCSFNSGLTSGPRTMLGNRRHLDPDRRWHSRRGDPWKFWGNPLACSAPSLPYLGWIDNKVIRIMKQLVSGISRDQSHKLKGRWFWKKEGSVGCEYRIKWACYPIQIISCSWTSFKRSTTWLLV